MGGAFFLENPVKHQEDAVTTFRTLWCLARFGRMGPTGQRKEGQGAFLWFRTKLAGSVLTLAISDNRGGGKVKRLGWVVVPGSAKNLFGAIRRQARPTMPVTEPAPG